MQKREINGDIEKRVEKADKILQVLKGGNL